MKYIKISKQHISPSIWDGGKTYEYFIYPPDKTYANRDFSCLPHWDTQNQKSNNFCRI
jgi:environmental stress-induced protein Ves